MNVLARIERACARVVEDTFARVFPSALDPAQIGRRLVAMAQASAGDVYLVRVHPSDYARLAPDRDFLEARWSAMLREAAGAPHDSARVVLDENPDVVAGSLAIEAVLDDHATAPPRALQRSDGTRIALRDGLTLGRARENGLVLRDGRASRVHARIGIDAGAWYVEDAGSSNGTFVDGVRIARAPLVNGAAVTLGETTLRVVDA